MKRLLAAPLLLAAALSFAQDGIATDEDALFGSEDDLFSGPLIEDVAETDIDAAATLLVSDTVQIGGRFSFSVQTSAGWNDASDLFASPFDPDVTSLSTALSTRLFLDARPTSDFRVFGRMAVSYPFTTGPARELHDVFRVEELWSDFNWHDRVFFRGGKQNMSWGVGYFYSPADLLSIAAIDPQNPEAPREGPVALKAMIPFGVNNLHFYALPTAGDRPLDIGVAAKGEVVFGGSEIGVGAIYQRDIAPAAMVTLSTSTRRFDLFAEGVTSYGSNRTFVAATATPPFVAAEQRADRFFFHGTGGFRWSNTIGDASGTAILAGQYLYNGEGYADPSIISDNPAGIAVLLLTQEISFADLRNTGRHYAAASLGWSDVLGSSLNASLFWMRNFSDGSSLLVPSLSRVIVNDVTVSVRASFHLGEVSTEFAPSGDAASVGLTVSLGGGSF